MEKLLNKVLKIEDYNGNTIMAIEINDVGNIINFYKCDIADIDKDYIFNSNKELIRLQNVVMKGDKNYV